MPAPMGGACPACGHDPSGARATPIGPAGDDLFPGYVVLRRVGAGGMGEVFHAHPAQFPKQLRAIKVIKAGLAGSTEALVKMFQREVIALQAIIKVPGIVPVLDSGTTSDGRLFLVMDWVEGRSLSAALDDPTSPLGQPDHADLPGLVAALVSQLGRALDGAHRQGVLHRDVKPSNVMLRAEPGAVGGSLDAVLIDFGIARLEGAEGTRSTSGALGTIEHIAPEVARGQPATERTDVYLLAHLAYRVLTGRRHATGQIRPPSRIDPRYDRDLDDLFIDALADEPADRPASCGELAERLTVLLREAGGAEGQKRVEARARAEEEKREAEARRRAQEREQDAEQERAQAEAVERAREAEEAAARAREAEQAEQARRQAIAEEREQRLAAIEAADPPEDKPKPKNAALRIGILLGGIGCLCLGGAGVMGVAIPNMLAMQLRAKRSEAPTNLDAIRTGEKAYHAEWDSFTSVGPCPPFVPGRELVMWDPAWACHAEFAVFGWLPWEGTRCSYEVVALPGATFSENDFEARALCDVDGDGNESEYYANRAIKSTMSTSNYVY